MGIGVSLSFIAVGAILAFALQVDLSGINIHMVGWILILVGLISMGFTLKYTRPRRGADMMAGTDPAYVDAEEAAEPDTLVREERIVERTVDHPQEHVERVIERPVSRSPGEGPPRTVPRPGQDPAVTQDPQLAQDPAHENLTAPPRTRRRSPFRR